jgi:hypothetical protein
MSADRAADVFLQIIPDVETLMEDEELAALMKNRKAPKDGSEATEFGKTTMLGTVAHLLSKRRENVWHILGALENKPPEEVAQTNIVKVSMSILGALQDKELISFFISLGGLAAEL